MNETPRPIDHAALFRLEWGGAHGWGHLVRSGALATELRSRGWRCDLWTTSEPGAVPSELIAPFSQCVALPGLPSGYDWLAIDHYGSGDEQLRAWRAKFGGRMLVIDDEAVRRLDAADLVVNARLALAESPYAPRVKGLLGERYALLRPGLRTPTRPDWQPPPGAIPVLVMLGGTDFGGIAAVVLEALADVDAMSTVPVVIHPGAGAARLRERFPRAVWVEKVNACELAGWAGACRFAISAAGGSLYELAVLRLPFVAVVVAENQKAFASAVAERWGMPAVAAGASLRRSLAEAIGRLSADPGQARAALTGIDGCGAARVADAMIHGLG